MFNPGVWYRNLHFNAVLVNTGSSVISVRQLMLRNQFQSYSTVDELLGHGIRQRVENRSLKAEFMEKIHSDSQRIDIYYWCSVPENVQDIMRLDDESQ